MDITIENTPAAPAAAGEHAPMVVIDPSVPAPDGPPDALDNVVPMVLFLAIALTYCVKYYFAHRSRRDLQTTVRMALERGTPLTPELLDRLGQAARPKNADLRRGVIGIGLGLGLGGLGLVLGNAEAVRPMLAAGMVPLLLGLAYLALWRFGGNSPAER